MMKESNFGPLLLLLLCALTPRNNSALPIEGMTNGEAAMSGPTVHHTSSTHLSINMAFTNPTSSITSQDGIMDGKPANIPSPTVDDTISNTVDMVIKGADILRETMVWLLENLNNSKFDEAILKFENDIDNISSSLAFNEGAILAGLYKTHDRIITRRAVLITAAKTLKGYVENLLRWYSSDDLDLVLLNYAAGEFVKYAEFVSTILEDALIKTNELNDQLSDARGLLTIYISKLKNREEEIEKDEVNEADIQEKRNVLENQIQEINEAGNSKQYDKVFMEVCTIYFYPYKLLHCQIFPIFRTTYSSYSNKIAKEKEDIEALQLLIDELDKQQKEIKNGNQQLKEIWPALESGTTILSHVKNVKVYLLREIILINNWKFSLEASRIDHKDPITNLHIKHDIVGITSRLTELEKACDDYLNHEVPCILKTDTTMNCT